MTQRSKIYITCPECKSPDVTCDATARWDYDIQDWTLSNAFDHKTCETCGYDSDTFDVVFEGDLNDAQRAYLFDDVEYVYPGEGGTGA